MPRSVARLVSLLLLAATAATAQPAPRAVDITAPDGLVLKATYYPAAAPGPGVVLLHMCNSDRSAWAGLGPKLAARGLHALALDYRGYGESAGDRFRDFRQQQPVVAEKWPGDVDAALAWLLAQTGVDRARIGAAGGSCGVNQAIQLARRHPGSVRALVMLAGDTDRQGEEFLAANPGVAILASASLDDGNAVEATRWAAGFSSNPDNRFLEYAQGGHGTAMFAVHAGLEPAIVDWFARHLSGAEITPPAGSVPIAHGASAELWSDLRRPGGASRLRERLRQGERLVLPPEAAINLLGYERIQNDDPKGAIEVLLLNVEAHPTSANTYDSLGDAYLADGQPQRALEMAYETLAALPGDPNQNPVYLQGVREAAEAKIAELRGAAPAP